MPAGADPIAARGAPMRYHPALVVFHWLVAALIVALLAMGFLALARMPGTDPQKITILRAHMAGGMLVLALMVVRVGMRWRTARPAQARSGSALLDGGAVLMHWGFYVVVPLMAVSGFVTARLAGRPEIVFGGSGAPLPASFAGYPSFRAHALLAIVLAAMVAVHGIAALYHQFVRRDALLGRMALGGRWRAREGE